MKAKRMNAVFASMEGRQRSAALVDGHSQPERASDTVRLSGQKNLPGIRLGELSREQRNLVRKVMSDLLLPFRSVDAEESMRLVESQGFEDLHLTYFKRQDLRGAGVWDVW